MQRVNTPWPPVGVPRASQAESLGVPGAYLPERRVDGAGPALLAALIAALAPVRGAAAEPPPLATWLSGIADAAQALADGRVADSETAARRALSALPRGGTGARASAALGLALARRGGPAEASRALGVALAGPTTPARAHLTSARGEALAAAGDLRAAIPLLEDAGRAEPLGLAHRARLRAGEALLAAGRPGEAIPVLDAEVKAHPRDAWAPAARLALAAARRAAGDEAGALEAYRALWLEADLPESRDAGAALAAWRDARGPVPPATLEDHLARADRLVASGRPHEALSELDAAPAAEASGPPAGPVAALRATALVALGRHADAERLAAPLAADADPSVRRSALLTLARAAARAGRLEDAIHRYEEVAAETAPVAGLPAWRQQDLADEAGYLAAWLRYDADDFAGAAVALDRFALRNPRSRRVDDARWFAAWSRYRLGRRSEAARGFARLARGPLADAAAYWQARLTPGGARRRALYRVAIAEGGDGWYALLARGRLAALGAPADEPPRPVQRPLPEAPPPEAALHLAAAAELMGLGLPAPALDELRALARTRAVRPAAALVAQLAAFAGDAELPFRMARDHLGLTGRALRWAHPEPYPDLVPARAAAFAVDPALLLAVMRRESSFRPEIRSGAGAEGLLQLLPATAERLAAVMGVPAGLGARLKEPEVSVALGAHYLGLLAGRFPDVPAAVAAYNAGPRPVAAWALDRGGMPLDAWVECIPYRETRQYVKIVLADWDVYRRLAGRPPAPIDPERRVRPAREGVGF